MWLCRGGVKMKLPKSPELPKAGIENAKTTPQLKQCAQNTPIWDERG
jgi:hypothetical protein